MPDNEIRLPARLYILGSLGVLAMGFGAATVFGDVDLIPAVLRFEDYGATLMVIGAVLMVPELIYFLRRPLERDETTAEL